MIDSIQKMTTEWKKDKKNRMGRIGKRIPIASFQDETEKRTAESKWNQRLEQARSRWTMGEEYYKDRNYYSEEPIETETERSGRRSRASRDQLVEAGKIGLHGIRKDGWEIGRKQRREQERYAPRRKEYWSPGNTFVFPCIISQRRSRYTGPRKFPPLPINGGFELAGDFIPGV